MSRVRSVWWSLVFLAGCTGVDDRPAEWAYLHAAVIQPSCTTASCHSAATAIAGVNLSGKEGAYTILTGRICGEPPSEHDPPGNYVRPYAVGSSRLYHLLVGENAPQMPPDTPLPSGEIELVARWIEDGAPCD